MFIDSRLKNQEKVNAQCDFLIILNVSTDVSFSFLIRHEIYLSKNDLIALN